MDILLQIVTDKLIIFFCLLMVGTIALFWKVRHQQVNAIASIVTVIGVCGTFVGIFIGILNFNTSNIETSVPELLEGLKLAFVTSIAGIGLSVLLKVVVLHNQKKVPPSATVDDLADLLRNIPAVEQAEGNETRETLLAIQNALTGDSGNTVMTQLQEILTIEKEAGKETRATLQSIENALTGDGDNTVMAQLQSILDAEKKAGQQTRETLQSIEKSLKDDADNTVMTQLQEILTVEKEAGKETRATLQSIENALTGDGDNTVMAQLQSILDAEKKAGQQTRETLQSIEKSLKDDADNTVMTQLQDLKNTFSNKQDELLTSFNEFATQMAENNIKALSEALEKIMSDFNVIITEHIGDNFKQLNEAVGRINKWQEQYRQQMDQLAEEFRVAAESIETSRQSLEGIAKQSDIIVSHIKQSKESLEVIADKNDIIVSSAEKLDPILEAVQHQIGELDTHLEAFSTLADRASNAFPTIKENLVELTDSFSTAIKKTITDSDKAIEDQRKALADQSEQLKTTVTESTKLMTEQIKKLDEELEKELKKALNLLGGNLASLSEKFVEDYLPLTEKLYEMVNRESRSPEPPSQRTQ